MKTAIGWSAIAAGLLLALSSCGSSSSSQTSSTATTAEATSAEATSAATTAPAIPPAGTTPVVITFDQVAVASSANALRTDLELKNTSKDPVLCDPSEFSIQLGSASPIDADTSAAVECQPDSIDPGTTGKATMYFDIPGGYTGPVTVLLTVDGAIVGEGTTQIH